MFDYVMVLGLDEPEDVPDSGTDADGHQAAVGTWGAEKDIIRGLGTAYGVSARPLCSCCCDWFAIATIGRTSKYQDGRSRSNAAGLRPALFLSVAIPLVGEKSERRNPEAEKPPRIGSLHLLCANALPRELRQARPIAARFGRSNQAIDRVD